MTGLNIFFVVAGVASVVGAGIACWQIQLSRKRKPVSHDTERIGAELDLDTMHTATIAIPSRNACFTGRDALLTDLREILHKSNWVGLTQVVVGLGGVGKTQLAIEYAHRFAKEYSLIAWLRSEDAATLQADMQALASKLDVHVDDDRQPESVVRAVHDELARRTGWLLVFDNAEGPETLSPYLPGQRRGHIIITSRNPNWLSIAQPITVNVFQRDESILFLSKRTGRSDYEEADAVAEALGDLPLALEQAAAFIEQTGLDLALYAREFESRHSRIWENQIPPDNYHATIATTWNMALERLTGTSGSQDVLKVLSFLGAEDVPLFLLVEGSEGLSPPLWEIASDETALRFAIADPRRYGLVDLALDGVSMHRLLQRVIRDGLDEEQREHWILVTLYMLLRVFHFSKEDPSTWERCERLLPHVTAAVGHSVAAGIANEMSASLLWSAGVSLHERANLTLAKDYLQRAVAIDKAAVGPTHPYVGRDLNSLASVLSDLGDLPGAEAAYNQALRIAREAGGSTSSNAAIDLSNLALVLKEKGDLQGAKSALEEALNMHARMGHTDSSSIATATNNLGQVLEELGDLQGAKSAFERAYNLFQSEYGIEHTCTASVAANLGSLLHRMGDLEASRRTLEQAVAVFERIYEKTHPNVATVVGNLATVMRDLGDLEAARSLLDRALRIDRDAYGPEHPSVASDMSKLGVVLHELGDIEGALEMQQGALRIDEEVLGPEHPKVATRLNNLGTLLHSLGDLDGAREACGRARDIATAVYGVDHPTTRTYQDNVDALK